MSARTYLQAKNFTVDSVLDFATLPVTDINNALVVVSNFSPTITGSRMTYFYDASEAKANHDGYSIISPTVPWDGTVGTIAAFEAGTGETDGAGSGCWKLVEPIKIVSDKPVLNTGNVSKTILAEDRINQPNGVVGLDGSGNTVITASNIPADNSGNSFIATNQSATNDEAAGRLDAVETAATNALDRANHTGTQTASTISDFDTEVSNNASVVANTAKVSADGSVTSHSDVTDAGSGIIISDAERTKLAGIDSGATAGIDYGAFNNGAAPTVAPTAVGSGALSFGENTTAGGGDAIGMGTNANAAGFQSLSLGIDSDATNTNSVAIGPGCQATQSRAFAAGTSATAAGSESVCIGYLGSASGIRSIVIGNNGSAGDSGIALGANAVAGGAVGCLSLGRDSDTANSGHIALGRGAQALRTASVVIGENANNTLVSLSSNITIVSSLYTVDSLNRVPFKHQSGVQTTDATVNNSMLTDLVDDVLYTFKVVIFGHESATGDTFYQTHEGMVKCSSGTATLIVNTAGTSNNSGSLAAASAVTVSGNDIVYQVTGEAAKTIDWSAFVEFKAMEVA